MRAIANALPQTSRFLMWAIIALMVVVNIWGIRLLPAIELIGGICHVLFFVLLLVTVAVLGGGNKPASFVCESNHGLMRPLISGTESASDLT